MKKEEKVDIKDMSLEGESQGIDSLNMDLSSSGSAELGTRLSKAFPSTDYIDISGNLKLTKMMAGNFKLNDKTLEEISSEERSEIDRFLKSRGG